MTQAQGSPCAGWYLNPQDDNSERWWDGTGWVANTRPLNHTPAEVPGVPGLLGMPGLPGSLGVPGVPGSVSGQKQRVAGDAQEFYSGHRQGMDSASGGALLFDGLVGMPTRNGNRGGGFKSLGGVFFGLVFVAVGFFTFAVIRTPANMSATASGTVTSVQVTQHTQSSSTNSRSSAPSCMPVAGFVVGGKTYTATSSVGISPCPWTVGQSVTVMYDPASPANAMIPSKEIVQYLPWIFGGVGVLLAVGSLFSFVRSVTELGAGGFLLMRAWRRRQAT